MREWYALKTKRRKEHYVAARLSRAGLEVYLPEVQAEGQPDRQPRMEPFFPGYLFSRLDPLAGEIRLAGYTSGVLHVLGYGEQPWPIPNEMISAIRTRLDRESARTATEGLKRGDRVVIAEGPLRDVEAVFDRRLSPTGRVRVLIRALERAYRADLSISHLRRLDGKAA